MSAVACFRVAKDFGESLRASPLLLSKQALCKVADVGQKAAKGAHMPKLELLASTGRDRDQNSPAYWDVQSSRVQLGC